MLYIPPRSTLHHAVLYNELFPIWSVLIHVSVFLSSELFASYKEGGPRYIGDWEATALKDRSSGENKHSYAK